MNPANDFKNLDYLASKHAQALIASLRGNALFIEKKKKPSDVDNTVTKALGVLTEDGIFAAFVYLKSHKERQIADAVVSELLNLTSDVYNDLKPENDSAQKVLDFISAEITADLERLTLCRSLYERMLIYARYGAKAWDEEEKAKTAGVAVEEADAGKAAGQQP